MPLFAAEGIEPQTAQRAYLPMAEARGFTEDRMNLEELTGYPFEVAGPTAIPDVPNDQAAYGWHGNDILPTSAQCLCDVERQPPGHTAIVLMDNPEPPADLPDGWTATAYAMADDWASDDGVWIAKAIHQKADGSWVFAGYCR
jgi:hypothetical protein